MPRFRYLVVTLVTLAVLGLGLVALLSTGGGKGNPQIAYAPVTTTTVGGLRELAAAAAAQAKTTIVPNVVGTSLHSLDRLKVIHAAGLNYSTSPDQVGNCTPRTSNVRSGSVPRHWSVVSQNPAAGSRLKVGSDVVLTVRECSHSSP
jgi:beta-lactam-binding protein with PASTA domain